MKGVCGVDMSETSQATKENKGCDMIFAQNYIKLL